uniref:Fuseless n=2 Tax=Lygus hesperus TaxID=30085 RepID=A0A0K8T4D1_LYGHE
MRGSTAGISDGLKGTSKTHYRFVTLLDLFLSTFLIAPLVVSYWRGTWGLMDVLVYPGDAFRSALVSCFIGYVGTSVLTLCQDVLARSLHPNTHRITYYAFSRAYSALFSFICVNHWRGGWMLFDFTGTEAGTIAIITGASVVLLMLTKTLRNLSAPPFAIATDRREGYFEVPRAFKYSTQNLGWYLLDCVFSVCVVGTLVVSVWRGHWSLLEIYLYPGEPAKSALASIAIGYALVIVTFLLQPVMKYLARTLTGIFRLLAVDIYLLLSFSGTINVWRGIWNSLNYFFLPNLPLLSSSSLTACAFYCLS